MTPAVLASMPVEMVAPTALRPHPRNYRVHQPDQLAHIEQSIREHGIYRNVVVARDDTILAGHGVVKACCAMQLPEIPIVRVDVDPNSPAALKLLTGDNEIGHLAEVDDRLFAELLKEVKELDPAGLLGTGYDENMLADLVFVTRSEIRDHQEAAAWAGAGMPEYEEGANTPKLIISFDSEEDRARFAQEISLPIMTKGTRVWSTWWPERDRRDTETIRFTEAAEAGRA